MDTESIRGRLESLINEGSLHAINAMKSLQANVPDDSRVSAPGFSFIPTESGEELQLQLFSDRKPCETSSFSLHPNALRQLSEVAGIPVRFSHRLLEIGRSGLLANNFSELFEELTGKSYLVRSVRGEIRGVLSDRYLRLDTGPILESFTEAMHKVGAVPIYARNLDTKFFLKVALKEVFEPYQGEYVAYGMTFSNSDFGNGAVSLRDWVLRLVCTNGMLGEEGFRRIHLGARMTGDTFSNQTLNLESMATGSAVKDLVVKLLDSKTIDAKMEVIREAHNRKIDGPRMLESMRRRSVLTKQEGESISELYRGAEVEKLPPGNTAWRLSNAISLLAQNVSPERALELEGIAGVVTRGGAK